jgi:uncharacterized protein YecT (DUF1311 family)
MIAALFLAADASESMPGWNCDNPVAQQEMNWCAAREFEKADAELNRQWKLTAAAMKQRDAEFDQAGDDRPGYFETLLAAQRGWLIYRDKHCMSAGYWARGGSLEPLLTGKCKTNLTQERTKQLRSLIEQ